MHLMLCFYNVDVDGFTYRAQMSRLTNTAFYDNLKRGVKISLASRIRTCLNKPISQWSQANIVYYADYIVHLPVETLQELSTAMDVVRFA